MEPLTIGCVVMAAGNARRFGANKLDAQVQGKPLIRLALEGGGKDNVTVVVVQVEAHSLLRRVFPRREPPSLS